MRPLPVVQELERLARRVVWFKSPGVFDERSWAYWHLKLGCFPPPRLPVRKFKAG